MTFTKRRWIEENGAREVTFDSNLGERLPAVFNAIRLYTSALSDAESDVRELEPSQIARLLSQWKEPLRLSRDHSFTNPWSTAGLGTDEVRISSVLAALWDERKYGGEARAFLARFLNASEGEAGDQVDLLDGYRIQTEHCLNGAIKDRVDITVETKSAIIGIEVKIYASERDMQLPDYVAAINKRAELMRRAKAKVIFLSPYASRNSQHTVPHISWRQLADCAALADKTTESGWLIQQFGEFCQGLGR